jgi:2-(1,2-epoxy-1,2-dihydrophenyl)acetyl-CoA isomerase
MGGGGTRGSLMRMRHMHRMCRAIAQTNKPVIAAVKGVCIGMSWAMALTCDMVVAAEDARFQFAFRHIGLAPDGGAAFLLTRYVPLQRAKEILYSGRFVSGAEAQQLGLALHALPADDVMPRALELARGFAQSPTIAIGMAKRQLDAAPAQTFEQALDFEANIQPLMVTTEDFKEGTAAFKEKRKPAYKGN